MPVRNNIQQATALVAAITVSTGVLLSSRTAHAAGNVSVPDCPSEEVWSIWYMHSHPELEKSWEKFSKQQQRSAAHSYWAAFGCKRGDAPNPFFDPHWYAEHNVEVMQACGRMNADGTYMIDDYTGVVFDWNRRGLRDGLQGSPLFDPKYYLRVNSDVAKAFGATNYRGAIAHYVSMVRKEHRLPAEAVEASGGFVSQLGPSSTYLMTFRDQVGVPSNPDLFGIARLCAAAYAGEAHFYMLGPLTDPKQPVIPHTGHAAAPVPRAIDDVVIDTPFDGNYWVVNKNKSRSVQVTINVPTAKGSLSVVIQLAPGDRKLVIALKSASWIPGIAGAKYTE